MSAQARKLYKCRCCQEWFNTTESIMLVHYRDKHPQAFQRAVMRVSASADAFATAIRSAATIAGGLSMAFRAFAGRSSVPVEEASVEQ